MLELAEEDIETVIIIVSHMFRRLSREMEDIKTEPNWTSRYEYRRVWEEITLGKIIGRLNIAEERIINSTI